MKSFADCFSVTVNLKKTKIVVFRKGGFWQEMKCGSMAIRTERLLTAINIWGYTSPPNSL